MIQLGVQPEWASAARVSAYTSRWHSHTCLLCGASIRHPLFLLKFEWPVNDGEPDVRNLGLIGAECITAWGEHLNNISLPAYALDWERGPMTQMREIQNRIRRERQAQNHRQKIDSYRSVSTNHGQSPNWFDRVFSSTCLDRLVALGNTTFARAMQIIDKIVERWPQSPTFSHHREYSWRRFYSVRVNCNPRTMRQLSRPRLMRMCEVCATGHDAIRAPHLLTGIGRARCAFCGHSNTTHTMISRLEEARRGTSEEHPSIEEFSSAAIVMGCNMSDADLIVSAWRTAGGVPSRHAILLLENGMLNDPQRHQLRLIVQGQESDHTQQRAGVIGRPRQEEESPDQSGPHRTLIRRQPPHRRTDVRCPRCGSSMVERVGQYGQFFGCSRYPNCHGTRPHDYQPEARERPPREVEEDGQIAPPQETVRTGEQGPIPVRREVSSMMDAPPSTPRPNRDAPHVRVGISRDQQQQDLIDATAEQGSRGILRNFKSVLLAVIREKLGIS